MGLLPARVRFLRSDYPDVPEEMKESWDTLLEDLGDFTKDVRGLVNGSLDSRNLRLVVRTLDVVMPGAWTSPSLLNSWVTYDSSTFLQPGYRKDATGRVWLRGVVKSGTFGSSPIMTLPVGYRPAAQVYLSTTQNDDDGRLTIQTDGDVLAEDTFSGQIGVAAYLDLAGSFEASDPSPDYTQAGPWMLELGVPWIPTAVWCAGCMDVTGRTPLAIPVPKLAWDVASLSGSVVVRIRGIEGLAENRRYRLAVVAFTA